MFEKWILKFNLACLYMWTLPLRLFKVQDQRDPGDIYDERCSGKTQKED